MSPPPIHPHGLCYRLPHSTSKSIVLYSTSLSLVYYHPVERKSWNHWTSWTRFTVEKQNGHLKMRFPWSESMQFMLCSLTLKKISHMRLRTSLKSKIAAVPSKDLAEGNSDKWFLATLIRSSNWNARRRGLRLPARDYVEREMPLPWTRRNVIISYFWRLKTSRRLLQIQKEIT